jgi:hypothetical protein
MLAHAFVADKSDLLSGKKGVVGVLGEVDGVVSRSSFALIALFHTKTKPKQKQKKKGKNRKTTTALK